MKKNYRKTIIAAVLALGFTASVHASVTTMPNFPTNFTMIGDLSSMPSFSVTPIKSTGSFIDYIYFSLSNNSSFGAYATNIKVPSAFSIANFTMTVDGNAITGDLASFANSLSTGDHSIMVSGTANGPMGGIYNLTMVAAPVPEAHEWMMMVAGLGVIGFILRKRRSAEVTAA